MIKDFYLSALVDFVDDASEAVFGPENVDSMMRILKDMGVRRIYWIHYGDASYEFFWKNVIKGKAQTNRKETIKKLGQPIKVAVDAAKKYGLEIYGYIKPYENGCSMVIPGEENVEMLQEGCLRHSGGFLPLCMKFVKEHPEMRIKRRMDDIDPNIQEIPVDSIKLYKKDDKPTRIKSENIQIWTSKTNYKYEYKAVDFKFSETIKPASKDFIDYDGNTVTKKSTPVRVLTLSGLDLKDKYILITTDFKEGAADFENSEFNIIEVFGPNGNQIPISIGLKHIIWPMRNFDFKETGIVFDDSGYGRGLLKIDTPNISGTEGFIAFTRGRNEYLPTALCESYREVRDFWICMVQECLDAGVDGVDFRIENHSSSTNDPFSYGFNEVILNEYQKRYGDVKDVKDYNLQFIRKIRGDFYTIFLKRAHALIKSYNKNMQVHLNAEFFRPDPPPSRYLAYPWNILFDWKEWIKEGIIDEATLRTYTFTPEFVLNDDFSNNMINECCINNIPVSYNRYMLSTSQEYANEIERVYLDGRFKSFIIYETSNFLKSDGKKGVIIKAQEYVDAIRAKAKYLKII